MRFLARIVAFLCFVVPTGFALLLWHQTGKKLFTQLPSEALGKMQDAKPAEDPFASLGMNDLQGQSKSIDNVFRLGVFPAGTGNLFADSASVATLAVPPCVLFLLVLAFTRTKPAPNPTKGKQE
jgi:hypothetical protein